VSVGAIRTLLERHGLAPRKDLGQNFLVDPDLARALVREAGVEAGDRVIEVGAGLGILTRALVEVAERVVSLEVDAGLVRLLEAEALLPERVSLRHADALEVDLAALVTELGGPEAPVRLVANLPYSVGSRVLRRVLDVRGSLAGWAVMVQKEVAERIVARPGSSDYGSLAVLHALTTEVRRTRDLAPRCFHPPPAVTSAFLRIRPRADAPLRPGELRAVERVVRAAFGQRRKTLVNALRGGGLSPAPEAETIRAVLAELGHDERVRAERLSPEEHLVLARRLGGLAGAASPPGAGPPR
jgi:16S rRNA (adenine1518-N6/adenine1519-N6)-dimethyltransferase